MRDELSVMKFVQSFTSPSSELYNGKQAAVYKARPCAGVPVSHATRYRRTAPVRHSNAPVFGSGLHTFFEVRILLQMRVQFLHLRFRMDALGLGMFARGDVADRRGNHEIAFHLERTYP
jgi:hypothetical protein